ncbi:MAG: FABP family protein, partial [Gemmatimonadetes bacterium]|nr:FABP family protein [Gemmatimonadota bacterium]NIR38287.1 FABP family protein [Actinomycetota bacterium]NIS32859.1 FABP family protein [Actinomycetota bacterium]NIT96511.1 FABP family protein [Actinomycetota bacterium]NIU67836.1 FABP family protein [Actinomycetota bacterium]
MELHEDVRPYGFLLGVWRGRGDGHYPTIEPFGYLEEISFSPGPGKPFVHYTQRTRDPGSGAPLHTECGYLRPAGPGRAELVLVSPTGII